LQLIADDAPAFGRALADTQDVTTIIEAQ